MEFGLHPARRSSFVFAAAAGSRKERRLTAAAAFLKNSQRLKRVPGRGAPGSDDHGLPGRREMLQSVSACPDRPHRQQRSTFADVLLTPMLHFIRLKAVNFTAITKPA